MDGFIEFWLSQKPKGYKFQMLKVLKNGRFSDFFYQMARDKGHN